MTVKGAALLKPMFDAQNGRNGRLSVQTDPRFYRDPAAILRQADHFAGLAPNIIVKIPVTAAGIPAIEEATYRGISINATVCFSLPQCVEVAEAVERGLHRREQEGKDIATMGPVCTIMVGRLDDWLKVVADKQEISVDPGVLEWAGVAVFKKTYRLFQERGYRIRLLSAAFRNHMHWSELIGGDVVISPPHAWQKRFNKSGIAVEPRIDTPVAPDDSRRAREVRRLSPRLDRERGLSREEFDTFPPTRRTLRQFITACHDLDAQVREIMLPNPDARGLGSGPGLSLRRLDRQPAGYGPAFRAQDDVGGQADGLEALHDRLGVRVVGVLGLDLDLHVAGQRRPDRFVLERRLVHRQAVLAPGRPEIDQHRLLFAAWRPRAPRRARRAIPP